MADRPPLTRRRSARQDRRRRPPSRPARQRQPHRPGLADNLECGVLIQGGRPPAVAPVGPALRGGPHRRPVAQRPAQPGQMLTHRVHRHAVASLARRPHRCLDLLGRARPVLMARQAHRQLGHHRAIRRLSPIPPPAPEPTPAANTRPAFSTCLPPTTTGLPDDDTSKAAAGHERASPAHIPNAITGPQRLDAATSQNSCRTCRPPVVRFVPVAPPPVLLRAAPADASSAHRNDVATVDASPDDEDRPLRKGLTWRGRLRRPPSSPSTRFTRPSPRHHDPLAEPHGRDRALAHQHVRQRPGGPQKRGMGNRRRTSCRPPA